MFFEDGRDCNMNKSRLKRHGQIEIAMQIRCGIAMLAAMKHTLSLPFLEAGAPFPPLNRAWPEYSDAPGLLAAGGCLDVETLYRAYRHGIFPWFGKNDPILWWSTHPRMVLFTDEFRFSGSLKKEIKRLYQCQRLNFKIDHDFPNVIHHCANTLRLEQVGTWIQPQMIDAYIKLHQAGFAHSVETWIDDKLVGGLYCVAIGRMVFGESMFTHRSNASKMALTALLAFCRRHTIPLIDCQQQTAHLASLGGRPISRNDFVTHVALQVDQTSPLWVWHEEEENGMNTLLFGT